MSLVVVATASAQAPRNSGPRTHVTDGVVGQFDQSVGSLLDPATVSAKFTPATADRPAILMITAKIAKGRHTYSLTQPRGGPLPTRIELEPSSSFRLLTTFRSQPAPNPRTE